MIVQSCYMDQPDDIIELKCHKSIKTNFTNVQEFTIPQRLSFKTSFLLGKNECIMRKKVLI
jgi:hypothetical protein